MRPIIHFKPLVNWVTSNKNRWKTTPLRQIGKEAGMSRTTVQNYLPEAVAIALNPKRDPQGILPSDVIKIRKHKGDL